MSDWLQIILALLMVLLLLSPLYVPAACFMAQVFLLERRPPYLLLILPIVSGAAAFGWFPSHWNEMARVFYCLDTLGAFAGSVLGGIVCAAANWKQWLKK